MEFIKIGRGEIRASALKGIKLSEAYERFHYLRKDVVKYAWTIANPKKKNNKRSK